MPQIPQPVTVAHPFPIPVPAPVLTEDSFILAEASVGRLQPGAAYASRDLYTFYAELCQEEGVTPLTANRYGRVLTKLGAVPGRDSSGSRRVWTLPAEG